MDSRLILEDFLANHGLDRVYPSPNVIKENHLMESQGIEVHQALSNQLKKLIRKVIKNSSKHFNPLKSGDFKESIDAKDDQNMDSRSLFHLVIELRNLWKRTSNEVVGLEERIGFQISAIERKVQNIRLVEANEEINCDLVVDDRKLGYS